MIEIQCKEHPVFKGYWGRTDGSAWHRWVLVDGRIVWKRLKGRLNPNRGGDYLYLAPRRNGRNCSITLHKFILECFIGFRPDGKQCRHLNGKAFDNRLENLCWGTPKEDAEDKRRHGTLLKGEECPIAKTNWDDVRKMRRLHSSGSYSISALAKLFGLSNNSVLQIILNRTWVDENYVPLKRSKEQAYSFLKGNQHPRRRKKVGKGFEL